VIPVYSDCNYIPGTWFASKMQHIKKYIPLISETLPESIIKKYNFISRAEALEKLHFPSNKHDFEIARERLAYDELYEINYISISKKIEKQNISE
jgi:ATP-dependent DNA helicase RecG